VIVHKANISTLDQTLTLHMHTQISHTIAQEIPVQLRYPMCYLSLQLKLPFKWKFNSTATKYTDKMVQVSLMKDPMGLTF